MYPFLVKNNVGVLKLKNSLFLVLFFLGFFLRRAAFFLSLYYNEGKIKKIIVPIPYQVMGAMIFYMINHLSLL